MRHIARAVPNVLASTPRVRARPLSAVPDSFLGLFRGGRRTVSFRSGRALFGLCAFFAVVGSAFATVIDFEGFPDSTPLTTQILGLTFTNASVITAGITLNEFEFPPHSGINVAFDDGGPMRIAFSTPEASVGAFFTYSTGLTFQAFDSSNHLLGTVHTAFSNNEALSGDPGSSPNEFLSLVFAGIGSVTITGDPAGGSFVLDDATYSTGSTTVPEPGSLSLLVGGLLALSTMWKSRYFGKNLAERA